MFRYILGLRLDLTSRLGVQLTSRVTVMLTCFSLLCALLSLASSTTAVQLLTRYLAATPYELGYCSPFIPARFEVQTGCFVQQLKPIAIVERGVGRHGTHVYTATMDEKQVVLKVAPACDIDCEVSQYVMTNVRYVGAVMRWSWLLLCCIL